MAGAQAFELSELQSRPVADGRPYTEFLRRPGVSMGLYTLAAGGEDLQHPHDADEVYVVLRGSAKLRVGSDDYDVRTGSVISVDRGVDHRFQDITEDLQVLVVFAPPEAPEP
ncbi:MAG TPA: cupin domain-containing protein [Jiangellaceae bacterium]|jgi:mannose-6-phosphate isomerase-like protein (cupin superfamily)|nr:cupin domain-containing protein [Jiangellaceae bacterium]